MTYEDIDRLNESNMTDKEVEYYKGVINKLVSVFNWVGLPKDADTGYLEEMMCRYGMIKFILKKENCKDEEKSL